MMIARDDQVPSHGGRSIISGTNCVSFWS